MGGQSGATWTEGVLVQVGHLCSPGLKVCGSRADYCAVTFAGIFTR